MRELSTLQYPLGEFITPRTLSNAERSASIDIIAALPKQLSSAIHGLAGARLDTPFRPGAWTIRQLIHHIADSHLTAYSWMRLALTEDWPFVYAYDPAAIAELPDSNLPATVSLHLIEHLHRRWVATLRSIAEPLWATRGYTHPETGRCSLEQALAMYAWHSRHHLAHITNCANHHNC